MTASDARPLPVGVSPRAVTPARVLAASARLRAQPGDVPAVERVGVVVPARNEERTLRGCLAALAAAATAVDLPVHVVVVLDSCTDGSSGVVTALARSTSVMGIDVVSTSVGTVGAARAVGVEEVLRRMKTDRCDLGTLWLATTDADSQVPPSWLRRHVELAAAGHGVVAGTVRVGDWGAWPTAVRTAYDADYAVPRRADGHGHVHGANLALRADLYRRIGGFTAASFDEDVALVTAAETDGAGVAWAEDIAVTTSARPVSRTPHGFSSHLGDHLAGVGRAPAPPPPRPA